MLIVYDCKSNSIFLVAGITIVSVNAISSRTLIVVFSPVVGTASTAASNVSNSLLPIFATTLATLHLAINVSLLFIIVDSVTCVLQVLSVYHHSNAYPSNVAVGNSPIASPCPTTLLANDGVPPLPSNVTVCCSTY